MTRLRCLCTICRQRLPTLKTLKSHYLTKHSKVQILRELFENCINNATPRFIRSKRRKYDFYKTVHLHDKIQITYNKDSIIIDHNGDENNSIELSSTKKIKPKKLFRIGIKKIIEPPKSLNEHTGEYYECHCREKNKNSSDTDSGSDTGKHFFCKICGSGYQTMDELTRHETLHQYYCKLCNRIFMLPNHTNHMEQHILRIYVCHLCNSEFVCKDALLGHLLWHFEQQTFENILDMEQDYNMYGFCNTSISSGNYRTDINNILFFLTYPYDHYYTRNMFMKVICDICYQNFYIYEYERHLKTAHFMG